MRNKRVPEIRFPGFTGDWEERMLTELMEFSNGINAPKESYGKGRKMISVMDILADEPIIYENIRNSVQVNDKTESKNKVENGDLVFVRSSEIPDEVGWAKAYRQEEYALYSGFTIRGKKKGDFDAKFIELSLNNSNREQIERKAGGSTRFNVSQLILKSIEISEPSIEEQIGIGDFFTKLDETIALHQQELDTLKQTKQGFLQKMFPKEGKSVPEVRFPGFTEDWEQRKLGDVTAEAYQGINTAGDKVEYSDGGVEILQSKHITSGQISFDDIRYLDKERYSNYFPKYVPKIDDILFANIGTIGPSIVVNITKEFLVAWNIMKITLNENGSPSFIQTSLQRLNNKRYFESVTTGNATKFVNKDELLRTPISLPNIEEQKKLGGFFQCLDDTIALHQQELEALQKTKEAFLQKMFV